MSSFLRCLVLVTEQRLPKACWPLYLFCPTGPPPLQVPLWVRGETASGWAGHTAEAHEPPVAQAKHLRPSQSLLSIPSHLLRPPFGFSLLVFHPQAVGPTGQSACCVQTDSSSLKTDPASAKNPSSWYHGVTGTLYINPRVDCDVNSVKV